MCQLWRKLGFQELISISEFGELVAPAGTPEEVIKKLNTAFVAALSDPAIVKQFEDQGVAVVTDSPSEFAKVISSDGERLAAAARSAGIKPQ